MAERRMFTVKITEADEFTALPPTTQCLYFHLCMSADDDGFSNKIRNSMFAAHADSNDLEMLIAKRFVIPFESGVVVIKHWRMHNLIRADRYHETDYLEEKAQLLLKENGAYTDRVQVDNQLTTKWQPSDNQMATEVRIGKESIDKDKDISSGKQQKLANIRQVIDYLNEVLGTRYTDKNKSNVEKIKARFDEGHTFEDFKIVIDNKVAQWKDDPKMRNYLRPETLFAASHFESYLNERGSYDGVGTVSSRNEEQRNAEIDETYRRIQSGEADHDDDGLWD